MKTKITCVIFDCDGTLVDSEGLCNHALAIKLQAQGIDVSAQALVDEFRGVQLTHILETLCKRYGRSLNAGFIDDYRALVARYFDERLQACEGVSAALASLPFSMCVASSGPLSKIRHALGITGLAHYFGKHVFSAFDIGVWKPEPDLFLAAAQAMQTSPVQCAVVEDSPVGIMAAKAAGMLSILYDPHGAYHTLACDYRITHMNELKGVLSAHYHCGD